jgi:hypothetical protein
VEAGSTFVTGSISRDQAIDRTREQLRLAGHDPTDGTIDVAGGQPGQEWYLTSSRSIDGYPVANFPAGWGPDGDKAYVTLRSNGDLEELYYLRPSTLPPSALPPTAALDATLDAAMQAGGRGPQTLAPGLTVERQLTWIRPTVPSFDGLVLSYCESARFASVWSATCVDASTGRMNLRADAAD